MLSKSRNSSSLLLEATSLLILSIFIASTCGIWQENVRPKLYVELGEYFGEIY